MNVFLKHREQFFIFNYLNLLQLKQYQQDFQGERLAREQLHQRLQEKEAECERVQKRADELQMMVDNYTHVHMQRLSNQYSHPAPSPSPVTPPSPNLYNQNPMSTLYSTGQSRNFTEQHSYMGDTQPMTTEDNQVSAIPSIHSLGSKLW